MNKTLFSGILLSLLTSGLSAEIISKDQINADNLYLFGGSMTEYLDPQVTYTPAPKGYKPFYMSHYGRHGSRYLLNTPQYEGPYNTLKEAAEKGVLTDFGKSVMDRLEIMKDDADGHLGDLTTKGKRQHREIAYRMVRNYPEIFNSRATITARSTTSHRVMASMTSALMEFARLLPKMTIDYDCSGADGYYMNSEDRFINSAKNSSAKSEAVSAFNARHTHPERLMTVLFTDTTFITRYQYRNTVSDRSVTLYNQIYEVAANMGSHELGFNLDDVFTYQEWYDNFTMNNIYWYSVSGFSPLTENIVPYGHATLLQDILDKANATIKDGNTNANLRYGHDTALFPLLCLMEINDCEWAPDNLEDVAEKWVDYDIVHMGSNLQLVFYKSKTGPVLVKALLNELEAELPIEPFTDSKGNVHKCYYEWGKLNKYYQDKLDAFYEMKNQAKAN